MNLIKSHNHNFIRMWTWEQAAWAPWTKDKVLFGPLVYQRTGPGNALDGGLRFDLSKFNQGYFDRLRSRVLAARDRSIYVSIMLFQGWSIEKKEGQPGNPWPGHPFNINNNVNGINGDANGDGEGKEVHTLLTSAIVRLQETYIRKVSDVVNDLDNVLYEISNEDPSTPENTAWQYHIINYIHNYEAKNSNQHPVLMTYPWPPRQDNRKLFMSPAEAISPGWGGHWKSSIDDYRADPPAAKGRKVIISDTDHLWGVGGDHQWVWKSFLRGLNPIFMDPYTLREHQNHPTRREWGLIRKNMGYTLAYSRRINLALMIPANVLSSTAYCLANPGSEYLIYLPSFGHPGIRWLDRLGFNPWVNWLTRLIGWNESVKIDLSGSPETFRVEWFNPRTGETVDGGVVKGSGGKSLTAPFTGDAVLYIYRP